MLRRPPGSTRTDTLFPYTTLFRSPGSGRSSIGAIRWKTWQMLCAFRRAASTLARLPLIFSDHLVPLHSEVCASFSNDASYAVLSGDHERGFNACVELCYLYVGSGTALRFLSPTGEVEEFDFATLRARA